MPPRKPFPPDGPVAPRRGSLIKLRTDIGHLRMPFPVTGRIDVGRFVVLRIDRAVSRAGGQSDRVSGGRAKMTIGAELDPRVAEIRYDTEPCTRQRTALDERLAVVLRDMTIHELRRLQEPLHELIREGLSTVQIAEIVEGQSKEVAAWLRFRETRDEAAKVVMLLGALAVAIAWLTYRAKPAPTQSLQQVIENFDEGHPYLLPVPRCDPCFCGSGMKFKSCHGRPPNAAPAVVGRRNDEAAAPL
jgi:hypothetical protein